MRIGPPYSYFLRVSISESMQKFLLRTDSKECISSCHFTSCFVSFIKEMPDTGNAGKMLYIYAVWWYISTLKNGKNWLKTPKPYYIMHLLG